MTRRRRLVRLLLPQLVLLCIVCLILPIVFADYDYDEYVREVLEEDQDNHHANEYYHEDSYYEKREAQQRIQEEQRAQAEADRVAAERERAFQAELDRMNSEQQKAALKQKKVDAKVVKAVLKAAEQNDLYKVLGIRNWDWKIPARELNILGFSMTIPGVTLKDTTMKDIRKAYRNRAMSVHPDKNKDGHAQKAFIVVEETASILSDQSRREEYDQEIKTIRWERRQVQIELVSGVTDSIWKTTRGILKAAHTVLGPFATPVIIIGALIA